VSNKMEATFHNPSSELHKTETALIHALRTIRALWPLMLDQTTAASSGMPASTDEVMSLDRLISLRHDVTTTLNSWARVVVDDRGITHRIPLGTDTEALAVFLERHAEWLSRHPAATEAADEIQTASRHVRAVAIPVRREWLPIGDCPVEVLEVDQRRPCGGRVRAYPDRQFIRCPDCGTEDTLNWWMTQVIPQGSDLAHADAVITFVVSRTFRPLSHQQLRQWATRGLVQRHGRDPKGRTLYSSRAVMDYVTNGTKETTAA
jgi:hypothetical protein